MDINEQSTQLADSQPHFDSPLRIAIPINAPPRIALKSRDKFIGENAFSPVAVLASKKVLGNLTSPSIRSFVKNHSPIVNMDHDAMIKTAIQDFTVVAFSSRRMGKKDAEAAAFVSLGIIHDNQGNYKGGIVEYEQYLKISEEIGDVSGCACACNCLGVNYMLLASPPSDAGTILGVNQCSESVEYLNKAIFYHTKHLQIGPDSGGRFVANTNLGLCYGMIGDITQSAKHHQDALRIAIQMQTLYGQSIAVGNLGMLALIKNDFATSRTCFEQHLQLVQALSDPAAEVLAWIMLSKISHAQGLYGDSIENLEQARTIAEKEGFRNDLRRILCLIGLSRGEMEFASYMDGVASQYPVAM